MFKKVQEAYKTLSNDAKRQEYDDNYSSGEEGAVPPPFRTVPPATWEFLEELKAGACLFCACACRCAPFEAHVLLFFSNVMKILATCRPRS